MELFKIVGIGLITCIACLIVRQVKPDVASIIMIAGGVVILLMVVDYVAQIFDVFKVIIDKTGLTSNLFSIVLKIVGVGYLTEFAANICSDTGCNSLADKILLAGKILILVMSLPIVTNIVEIVVGLLWRSW